MTERLPTYLIAALIGTAATLALMPIAAILGTGAAWNPPFPDQAQALTAHLAFQADIWRWPLLDVGTVFWPHGISVALTDSNPLISLFAKVWTKTTGDGPVNLFGVWMASCWVLQAVSAAYAARGLGVRPLGAIAAAALAVSWPALLARMGHLNLCAHFLVLFSLGLVFRRLREPGRWSGPATVLVISVLVHPYIFQLCAVVFAVLPLHACLAKRRDRLREVVSYVLSGMLAAGTLILLSGPLGGGDKGFVYFSMNLLSPVWPARSGVFGSDIPMIDATGGQYEGYNWLGAGVMLLLAAALAWAIAARAFRRPALREPFAALWIILAGLTLLSLSSRVYVGHFKLLDLGAKPWEDIFGTFRAPGRAFWPVGYAIMLFAVAAMERLPKPAAIVLLVVAAGLQTLDGQPLRREAGGAWMTGDTIAVPPVPKDTTLFTVGPYPGCAPEASIKAEGPIMLLAATRAGARIGEIGLGRAPKWFNCQKLLSDTLQLPLDRGESRAYFGPTQAQLRTQMLGPDAVCRRVADAILCGRDVQIPPGTPVPAGAPLARLIPGTPVSGAALAPFLINGWRLVPETGVIWSEWLRGSLAFLVPEGADLTLTIEAEGVAPEPDGTRSLHVFVGRMDAGAFTLRNGKPDAIVLHIKAADVTNGVLRVALDPDRVFDPKKWGMATPVERPALKLRSVTLTTGST